MLWCKVVQPTDTISEIQSNTIDEQNYYTKGCEKIFPLAWIEDIIT
jgi:hypothetical protein